jgi:hypothetical protein
VEQSFDVCDAPLGFGREPADVQCGRGRDHEHGCRPSRRSEPTRSTPETRTLELEQTLPMLVLPFEHLLVHAQLGFSAGVLELGLP